MPLRPPLPTPSCELSGRFFWAIDILRRAIQPEGSKSRAGNILLGVLWYYLCRTAKRFDAQVRRWHAGRLKPRRARAARPEPEADKAADPAIIEPEKRATRPRPPRLPDRFGWVGWLVPEAHYARGMLEPLLADPEMAAFLEACPQAVRLLRPLCWMLGMELAPGGPASVFPRPRPTLMTPECVGVCRPPAQGWWMRRHTDGSLQAIPPPAIPFKLA